MNGIKPTSAKQVAANRRNALKSTGPRTAEGRAVSKMNALKHGILSKQVLVQSFNLEESEEELVALHLRFWEELQPDGPLEEMLVDQIVTAHWRLRRALTAESGEIALSVDATQKWQNRRAGLEFHQLHWTAFGDLARNMENSSWGNALLGNWLREVHRRVEAEGGLSEEVVQDFARRFGNEPNSLTRELEAFRLKLAADPDRGDAAQRERQKAETLTYLSRKIGEIDCMGECCVIQEKHEEEAQLAAATLPSAGVLDKLLRYETKLERQMSRAMVQLERVQRMRRGEAIPAPLSVEVSDRG